MLSSIEVPNVCLKAGFRVAVVSRRNGFQISGKSFTKKLFLEKARSYMFNIAASDQIFGWFWVPESQLSTCTIVHTPLLNTPLRSLFSKSDFGYTAGCSIAFILSLYFFEKSHCIFWLHLVFLILIFHDHNTTFFRKCTYILISKIDYT